ncbi:hypothetical protein LIER_06284 [Lithospermum erythrorhizon]|uniref:Uncharacterized protein n=1 Tax=Lithospermum erythrorhizon TaxID=34254 RepID=A0AAV3P8H0_LITER
MSNVASRPQPLATQSSTSSAHESDTLSAESPSTQVAFADKVTSKFIPQLNVVKGLAPMDKMSQSSENRPEEFQLCPRGAANQPDRASTRTPLSPSANPLDINNPEGARDEAAQAEKAYQDMMASLPTFVKNSTPPDLADDELDDELVNIAFSQASQLVDFNVMLMDRPSLFTWVAITTKTKPCESLVHEALPKKAKKSSGVQKKKGPQPLARDSSDEGSWPGSVPSPVEAVVTCPPVVTLDSSTTVSNQDMGRRMETTDHRLSLRQELSTLFPSSVQQMAVEEDILPLREKATQEVPQEEASPSTPRLRRYSDLYMSKHYSIPT